MRIYFYTQLLAGKGGLEKVLEILSNNLSERGHEVRVLANLTPQGDEKWLDQLPNAINCSRRHAFGVAPRIQNENDLFERILTLQDILRKLPTPDVLIVTHPTFVQIAKIAINGMDKRPILISWIHGSLENFQGPHVLDYADAHIAISSGIAEQLKILSDKPVQIVYNPIIPSKQTIRRSEVPTFLYVGRVDNGQKRVDVLFKALGEIKHLNWRLKIVGGSVLNSKDEDMLKQFAQQQGIAEKIEWMGWQERPWDVVEEATALVLSSDYEGFPMIIGEALSRGLPVVSSNCKTGPIDMIEQGENGWLFPTGDFECMANILGHITQGQLELPTVDVCKRSIERFAPNKVIDTIENAVNHYVMFVG